MTVQEQYPIGTQVLNLTSHLAEVVGHHSNGELILKGISEFASVGKWLAPIANCYKLSSGHFGLTDKFEYFVRDNDLYRALRSNPIVGNNDYRQGARLQLPCHLLDSDYLRVIGL